MSDTFAEAAAQLSLATEEWLGLSDAMREDLRLLINSLTSEPENQMLRRAFVRACWAYVEGVTFAVKDFMRVACQFDTERLTQEDHAFLANVRSPITVDPMENLKRTFRLAAYVFDLAWQPDFGGEGYQALHRSLQIRHRLTHPKSVKAIDVGQSDFKDIQVGVAWFIQTFTTFEEKAVARFKGLEP